MTPRLSSLTALLQGLIRLPRLFCRAIATEAFQLTTGLRLGRRRSLWGRDVR